MSNNYLSFMTDEHLFSCIEDLYSKYIEIQQEMDLNSFYRNKVDPIKFYFDMKFNDSQTIEDYLKFEIIRQNDKTINNAIGDFHQNLIGGLPGLINLGVGNGCDIRNENYTIWAEIKNKHNTMNSSSQESTFQKLAHFADKYPNSTCYLIEIIAKKSQNILWKGKFNGTYYSHDRVRRISVDQFYYLVTGIPDAFKQLCLTLPKATNEFLEHFKKVNNSNSDSNKLINAFRERESQYDTDILNIIFYDTFNTYIGFKK